MSARKGKERQVLTRTDYRKGRRFRVIREGAWLVGLQPAGEPGFAAQKSWTRLLRAGEIITCAGEARSRGDGIPVIKWRGPQGEHLANDCEFHPEQGDFWRPQPADGYLELLEDDEVEVTFLPPVCWVHRPHDLRGAISEAEDFCPNCCEKRVAALRRQYPDYAAEILTDGGWDPCRQSESLPTCEECGCKLGCYLLDTFYGLSSWTEEGRCIDTYEKWDAAMAWL